MIRQSRKKLGDLLIEVGMISKEQLEKALEIQKQTSERVGDVLLSQGYITEQDIIKVLEFQLGFPQINLEKYNVDVSACLSITENLARRYGLIPIRQENGILTVAMSDPLNVFAIDDIKMNSGFEVQPAIATKNEINRAIDLYYNTQKAMKADQESKKEHTSTLRINSKVVDEQEIDEINSSPAVKLVNSIIEEAVKSRASDIHIEPFEKYVKIRYRTDGQLYEVMRPEIGIMSDISTRIKIISGINIAEKGIAQDGRISVQVNENEYDLRVSILPTVYGEKIVIKLANKRAFIISKDNLGLNSNDKAQFEKILLNPHGVILVTGPKGSGKSTTLYSAVSELNKPNINIITVEQPIECLIEGVNQVSVNYKTGLTFAEGLRSILKQDPNVIMVGEISDTETAGIVVRAAITGHLVLSTLHANDAASSVIRLKGMGIEPFLVATSVVGVIAQRLVRKVCSNCVKEFYANEEQLELLQMDTNEKVKIYEGMGCPVCNGTGYKGRLGIYEVMTISKKHRDLIMKNCTADELTELSVKNGMMTLRQNVREKVLEGLTTIEEMTRITYSND